MNMRNKMVLNIVTALTVAACLSFASAADVAPTTAPAMECPVSHTKADPSTATPGAPAAAPAGMAGMECPVTHTKAGSSTPPPSTQPALECPVTHTKAGPEANGPAPTTAPATHGSIDLQVVQGTQGGPAIGGSAVSIQLYSQGGIVQKYDLKLDANGHAAVADVPVSMAMDPVVTCDHAGLTQQTIGTTMDPANPNAKLHLTVYEPTAQLPSWTVAMRHMIVHNTPEGLQVTEMLSVNNPTDRVWLGTPVEGADHVTVALTMPEGIAVSELGGGFQEPYAKQIGRQLASTMPLFPGSMQFQIGYTIPVRNGAATLTLVAPAPVGHLMIFLPGDASTVTPRGVESAGTMDMGRGAMRVFKAADLKAGQSVSLALTGIPTVAAPADPAAPVASAAPASPASANLARNVGAIGGALILLAGGGVLLFKKPKVAKK